LAQSEQPRQKKRRLLLLIPLFLCILGCLGIVLWQMNGINGPVFPPEPSATAEASPASNLDEVSTIFADCLPPCWIGIEPGVTHSSDAEAMLKAYYGPDNVDLERNTFLYWSSSQVDSSQGGSIRLENNRVLQTRVGFAENQLRVSELVEVLGEPEFVQVTRAADGINCAGLSLIFPEFETEAILFPTDDSLSTNPSQSVSALIFSAPGLTGRFVFDTFQVDWQGYQAYCSLSP
jgi:hypothetical protein